MTKRPRAWRWCVLPLIVAAQAGCTRQADATDPQVITIEARRFAYSPAVIRLKKDQPVVLELISKDGLHGFNAPELGLRSDVIMDGPSRLTFTPRKTGRFIFHCDIFCGSGHDQMAGEIVVVDD